MVETTAPSTNTEKGLSKLQEILNSIGDTTGGNKKNMLKVDAASGSNLEKILIDIKKVMDLQAGYLSKIVDYQNEQKQKERLASASGASPEKLQPGGDSKPGEQSIFKNMLGGLGDIFSKGFNIAKWLGIPIIAELFGKFTPLIIGVISQLPKIANLLIDSISLIGKSIGLISSVIRSIPGIVSRLASFSMQLYNTAKFAVTAITDASKLAANTIVNALRPVLAPLATALGELGASGVGLLAGGAAAIWGVAGGLPILLQKYFGRSKEEAANTTNTITPANSATKQDINDMINYQLKQNPIDSSQSLDDIFSMIKGSISDQTGGMLTSGKIGQLELNTIILQKAREVKGDPNAQLSPELDKLSDYVSSVPLSTRKSAPRYTFPEGATGLGTKPATYTFPEGATGLKASTFVAPFSNQLTDPNRLRLNRSGAPSVIMVPTPGKADSGQQGSVTTVTNIYQTKDPAASLASQMPGGGISDIPIFNWGY